MALGSILIQFGGKYFVHSMCTLATFGMTCSTLCVLYGFVLPASTPQYIVWITVFFSMGVGAGLGYGVYNWPKAGIVTLGFVSGSFWGTMVYVIFLSAYTGNQKLVLDMQFSDSVQTSEGISKPIQDIQSEEIDQLLICISICATACIALSVFYFEQAIIYGTCFCGSYLLVRGVSVLIGGFPNEFLLFDSL